ncbi:MAG: hypothetical protein ABGZ35_28400 [Planctomycetaceae bacterium]
MKTDLELKSDGMKLLRSQLGLVESERFLTLMLREPFDYTKWRQHQWGDHTVADLAEKARQLRAGLK